VRSGGTTINRYQIAAFIILMLSLTIVGCEQSDDITGHQDTPASTTDEPHDSSSSGTEASDENDQAAQQEKIQATNERIHGETVAFVQKFSDALGLPVLHNDYKFTWGVPTIPYIIDEIPIEIGFIGELPLPRVPQMYDKSQSYTRNTILQVQRQNNSQIQLLSGVYVKSNNRS